jgi:hypothetical protein
MAPMQEDAFRRPTLKFQIRRQRPRTALCSLLHRREGVWSQWNDEDNRAESTAHELREGEEKRPKPGRQTT